MNLNELLLKSSSFTELLKRYNINVEDFEVEDEGRVLSALNLSKSEAFQERVVIKANSPNGCINLIGIMHCNLIKGIAVFEMEYIDHGIISKDRVFC